MDVCNQLTFKIVRVNQKWNSWFCLLPHSELFLVRLKDSGEISGVVAH